MLKIRELKMKETQKGNSKTPSQRQLRVAEEIRHVLGRMLSQDELFIDGLKPTFLMVTEVKIAPDFSVANVFIQAIGDLDTDDQVSLLNRHKGVFRYQVGKSVRLRIVPALVFKNDNRFEQASYINDLLNSPKVRADLEKPHEDWNEDAESESDQEDSF